MFFNNLPDDCLLAIFKNFNSLEDIIKITKVCYRWKCLILHQCISVKYLLARSTNGTLNSVYFNDPTILKEVNLVELLPNLKIVDIDYSINQLDHKDMVKIVTNNPTIRGLIDPIDCSYQLMEKRHFGNIEMIVSNCLDRIYKSNYNPLNLNQIYLRDCRLSMLEQDHSNLIRLHLNDNEYTIDNVYNGSTLYNLKILELKSGSYAEAIIYPGYLFMDSCPSLQSAFFNSHTIDYYIDEKVKNYNLRDLVIEHEMNMYRYCKYSQNWPSLKRLLSKFPNLKHLAIRNNDEITDDHLIELIQLLPNIKLFDFRRSIGITRKSADYLDRHCQQSGRSIVIYYDCGDNEPIDWPKIDHSKSQICSGFNFMKHCFFRSFYNLPLLLDN